jgi:glycosyltransferase involved in cell wall biosynthesis
MTDLAVIMSVYKNDKLKFLEKSVQSILNQTVTEFNYYIVFDGPVEKDIERYISSLTDRRIKHFRLEKNEGLANALNYLLEEILKEPEYKFIARMDADDISVPERFERQRTFLLENPEISCVGSWYQEIDENGNLLSNRILPIDHEGIRRYFIKRNPFAHPSVMLRRDLINKIGYYPTNTIRLEDYIFWGNALSAGMLFANIPEYLLQFRRNSEFYKKRSGLNYGFNFIKERFRMNIKLNAPIESYLYSLIIGMIRMMPAGIFRFFYKAARKYL